MGREGTAIGMFDSIQCNYPLPLPLEVVNVLPDLFDQEFQTKDFENLLDNYILNEEGELFHIKKEYKWKTGGESFLERSLEGSLEGSLEVVKEETVPYNFHGVVNFYCYATVNEDSTSDKAQDVSLEYLAKFTNGKLENIELFSYEIIDATVRLLDLKAFLKKQEEKRNLWYNKYFFYTKFWKVVKWKVIIAPINLIKKVCDNLHWLVVKYL
jgi:hypothetical protein